MIEIQEICLESPFSCTKQVFLVIYAASMFIISTYCIYNIRTIIGKFTYEHLPLASCAVQSISHLIMFLFYSDNRLEVITAYFCLFTYIFVAQSFVYLYMKLSYSREDFKFHYRIVVGISIAIIITLTIFTSICIVYIEPSRCNKYFNIGQWVQLLLMFTSSLVCWGFGVSLQRAIKLQASTDDTLATDGFIQTPLTNEYKTLNSQINFVIYILFGSSTLFLVLNFIEIYPLNDLLCQPQTDTLTIFENTFVLLYSILEMTPCLAIPYVFYYLPHIQRIGFIHKGDFIIFQSDASSSPSSSCKQSFVGSQLVDFQENYASLPSQ